jgi:hypothetical protein
MEENDKRKKVMLSMYDEDIKRLNAASERSGCNKSEYVRRMLRWSIPKPIPDKRFWELMNDNAENNTNILMACEQLEDWIMKFQSESTLPWEVA